MARTNIWEDWRPPPQPFEDDAIEHEHFELLQNSAKPFAVQECRDLHGCSACRGFGTVGGETCLSCEGSGVGTIKTGSHLYCDRCGKTGVEDDPRLVVRPGEMPQRERLPKTPPTVPTLKALWPDDPPKPKRGRPKGAKDKKPRKQRSFA